MRKKAQGMSLETIVIAVIVLIVLVVLILIFSGKIGKFNTSTGNCPGTCTYYIDSCKGGIGYKLDSCGTTNQICCTSGLETNR